MMIQNLAPISSAPKLDAATVTLGQTTFRARWIDRVEDMKRCLPQWEHLVQHSLRGNFCFEPGYLIPAFEYLESQGARLLVVESMDAGSDEPSWSALVPLKPVRFYGLPLSCLEIWKHDQCFDGTPLLRKSVAADAFRCLLGFLRQQKIKLLSLECVSAEEPFFGLMQQMLATEVTGCFERDQFSRACFRPLENAEQYMTKHVSKSIRRNSRRLIRRLEDQGKLDVSVSDKSSDFAMLAEQFMQLEASGWKRESGTALLCNESTTCFFKDMVASSAERNRVRFLTVSLDNRPIAMLCDLYSDCRGFSYKTAFDDEFANYSPGTLAELFNIEKMHGYDIELVDSCTDPDNDLMNRMWGDRLKFQNLVVSLSSGPASWSVRCMPSMQTLAQRIRSWREDKQRRQK